MILENVKYYKNFLFLFLTSAIFFWTCFVIDVGIDRNSYPILGKLWFPAMVLLLFFIDSHWRMNYSEMAKLMNTFPQPSKLAFIGSMHHIIAPREKLIGRYTELIQRYGRCFACWFGSNPFVILAEAKDIEKFLSSEKHLRKGKQYDAFRWLLGDGLLTSEGEMWKHDRKLLGRSFHYEKLDKFLTNFNKHCLTLLKILEEKFDDETKNHDIQPYIMRFAIDAISESALGSNRNVQLTFDDTSIHVNKLVTDVFLTKVMLPWTKLPIIRNITGVARKEAYIHKIIGEQVNVEITDRRAKREEDRKLGKDTEITFLDVLLDTKSDEKIKEHAVNIFGAGFESTSIATCLTLFLLALNPECQKQVQEEQSLIFKDNPKRDVTMKDLSEMKHLEMCIKESMRIYTPAISIIRLASENVPLDNERIIPKGSNVMLMLHHLHRDETVFPNPETFIPTRFDVTRSRKLSQYEYLPFSAGSRNCIGWRYAMIEMKTVISHILRKFEISTEMKREDLKIRVGMFIDAPGGIPLSFKKRKTYDHVE